jgi:hypothetical protein
MADDRRFHPQAYTARAVFTPELDLSSEQPVIEVAQTLDTTFSAASRYDVAAAKHLAPAQLVQPHVFSTRVAHAQLQHTETALAPVPPIALLADVRRQVASIEVFQKKNKNKKTLVVIFPLLQTKVTIHFLPRRHVDSMLRPR